jgi:hypothetical protein
LKQEKEKNERKNEKILEILQIKDSLIEDLEEKNSRTAKRDNYYAAQAK